MTSRSAMSSSSSTRSAATHRPTRGAARSGPTSTQQRPHADRRSRPRENRALPLRHRCGRLCATWRDACTGGGRSARTRRLLTPALPERTGRCTPRARWRSCRALSVAGVSRVLDQCRPHPRESEASSSAGGGRAQACPASCEIAAEAVLVMGMRAVTVVPSSRALATVRWPPSASTRSESPRRPLPSAGRRPRRRRPRSITSAHCSSPRGATLAMLAARTWRRW